MSTPVIDKMVAGQGFPMVLVDKRVVCVDGIDVDAVVHELSVMSEGSIS